MTRRCYLAIGFASASALIRLAAQAGAVNGVDVRGKTIDFKISIDNGAFTQAIAVGESDSFEVVSQFDRRRWTVRGTTGRIEDDALPVDLTVECWVSPTIHESATTPRKLKLDGTWCGAVGAIGGMMIDQSATRRTAGPPSR